MQPLPTWKHLSDFKADKPITCASVGWLIKDGKKVKVLVPNMGHIKGGNVQGSGFMHIAASAVRTITPLVEKDGN